MLWNRISCEAGLSIDIGNLVYEPPRDGPTLWEIGIPDRTAAEFYVPDPNPLYINKLYVNHPDRLVPFNFEFFVTCTWNCKRNQLELVPKCFFLGGGGGGVVGCSDISFSLANVLLPCIQFQYFRRIFCSFEINMMNGNKNLILFFSCGRFRQYGLWERYAELYPDGDLVYMIGNSDYRKDWFFAQVTRFEFLQYYYYYPSIKNLQYCLVQLFMIRFFYFYFF